MTTHAQILAELERYEKFAFVPMQGDLILQLRDDKFVWFDDFDGIETEIEAPDFDAESHIERAAFRAVSHWCKSQDVGLVVSEVGCTPWAVTAMGGQNPMHYLPLASGPTEPAMWLAAMKYINGEKA